MKELSIFIDELEGFREVKAHPTYYLVTFVFHNQDNNIDKKVFRKTEPQKYRLLQAVDFICFMELLKIKIGEKRLSRLEEQFFYKPQE